MADKIFSNLIHIFDQIMELTGIILAGGKSSRMGEDKGLLNFKGKKLIEYSIDLLKLLCNEILISTNQAGYEQFGFTTVADKNWGCGPIGGIEAGLQQSKNEWCIVIACDTPFLEHDFLTAMISEIKEQDCIIPSHNNGIEPLVGIYNKELAFFFSQKIEQKEFKIKRIIEERQVHFFNTDPILKKYPKLFFNMNTMEDMESIGID